MSAEAAALDSSVCSADAADQHFMAQALRLAERGLWTTTPNPRVGCVLVRDGRVIGEGWHERAGEPHAEVNALRACAAAGESAAGATAYVTLEPCSHFGRTPPCADGLIQAGVRRVVAAMQDPNPQVAGNGLERLRAAGIEVRCGVQEAAARELNLGFVRRMTTGRPWVRVKLAASLDGRTALSGGESQWITHAEARRDTHRWRARACAVLTGSGTVQFDDPTLTVREVETPRQPLRVLLDGSARLSSPARLLDFCKPDQPVLQVTARPSPLPSRPGFSTLCLPAADGVHVDLDHLLDHLGRQGCNELHVEAGAKLAGALLQRGLVDELLLYVAPYVIGSSGRGLFDLPALASLADKIPFVWHDVRQVGRDMRLILRPAV